MTKAKWLKEVSELLEADAFKRWWDELSKALRQYEDISDQYDELLTQNNLLSFRSELTQKNAIDTLYKAGEYEDHVAAQKVESDKAENRSFEAVGNFENQRVLVSELWYKLGGAEQTIQELKEAREEAAGKLSGAEGAEKSQLKSEIKHIDGELKSAERGLRKISQQYHREAQRKNKYWEEVERMWNKSMRINLGIAEKNRKAGKFRRDAERMFRQAEQSKQRAEDIQNQVTEIETRRSDLEQKIKQLYQRAEEQLECVAGEDFLYWPQKENSKAIYCLSLVADQTTYNIEVRALTLYQVDRQKGVAFVEPIRPDTTLSEEQDNRLEDFFLNGRPAD